VGNAQGFIQIQFKKWPTRPVEERIQDWREVYLPYPESDLRKQASRCMDCGIPFCHQGCPLGNLIPDWNDLVYRDQWKDALDRLHATNNFPEFTGRLCPAPCEGSCVLGINNDPVTIKAVEVSIIDRGFDQDWVEARPPATRTGKRVAVVGSGPAGLAAAEQLNRAGHWVIVFERDDRIGGLLRYGIPDFKMEKRFLDRRLALMREEGVAFRPNSHVGVNVPMSELLEGFDAAVLAGGACAPRNLAVPGRELAGVHYAMEYLTLQNRIGAGDSLNGEAISASGRNVVIIGGGDTGADCLGTAHRQGARSVVQIELLAQPPAGRASDNPWPEWPNVFRVSPAHEEGGKRVFAASTQRFVGDENGRVKALEAVRVEIERSGGRMEVKPVPGSEFTIETDLVLLAMGFAGPEKPGLLEQLGVRLTDRGNVWRDDNWMTNVPGVFTCGDMQRGQSLIVWAIAEGRSAARGVDAYLMGSSALPAPVK
jgi:glutamate synthase (NADPH/NADH) small chain